MKKEKKKKKKEKKAKLEEEGAEPQQEEAEPQPEEAEVSWCCSPWLSSRGQQCVLVKVYGRTGSFWIQLAPFRGAAAGGSSEAAEGVQEC